MYFRGGKDGLMCYRRVLSPLVLLVVIAAGCQESPQFTAGQMESAAAERSNITGQPAPDFTLLDQNEVPLTLSDHRGQWVVLYFYPKDDTPGCTCQATEFTSLLGEFRDMNARIYGINADTPAEHRKFIQRYALEIDLLSDPDRDVMREYGAWFENSLGGKRYGRVVRTTMIVGPDGTVRYHWPEVIPQGHAERVRQKLAELRKAS